MNAKTNLKFNTSNLISDQDIFYAYKFFLGRPPESDLNYIEHKKAITVDKLLSNIISSEEFKSNNVLKEHISIKRKPTYFKERADGSESKIIIISGCQGEVIQGILSSILSTELVLRVYTGEKDWLKKNISLIEESEIIITQRKEIISELTNNGIHGKKIIEIPLIEYSAYHPDMCLVLEKNDGKPIVGPMGEYHSSIILASYLSGNSEKETENLFNEETYLKLGFAEIAKRSEDILASRLMASGISAEHIIKKWNSKGIPWMWSTNHPKKEFLAEIVKFSLSANEIDFIEGAEEFTDDPLSYGPCWPTYASRISLDKITTNFKLPASFTKNPKIPKLISLQEMIEESFYCYRGLARDNILVYQPGFGGINLDELMGSIKTISDRLRRVPYGK